MIEREIAPRLQRWFEKYPVVTITGPRQSGKTTLARQAFPNLRYVDLEAPDEQEAATVDPRGFLARYPDGVILDEIQHVPELASYIKVAVDMILRTVGDRRSAPRQPRAAIEGLSDAQPPPPTALRSTINAPSSMRIS